MIFLHNLNGKQKNMLDLSQLDKILFLDIETVPEVYHYTDLEVETTKLFDAKNARYLTEADLPENIPIFPLSGVLLLSGAHLPLNVVVLHLRL